MQPSLKKLEVFFFGTETPPYTHHLNQKSWILLPLVSIGILSLILVRALSTPESENQCPIKQRRREIGLLAALCQETDWGCSFCCALLWSQHQQIREQFHGVSCTVATCNLAVYNFQEMHLKTFLDYSKQETEKNLLTFALQTDPLLRAFFSCSWQEHHPPLSGCTELRHASHQHRAPLPCPAKGGRNFSGNAIYDSHTILHYSHGHAGAI